VQISRMCWQYTSLGCYLKLIIAVICCGTDLNIRSKEIRPSTGSRGTDIPILLEIYVLTPVTTFVQAAYEITTSFTTAK
jgi:hypothetical protein